MANFDFKRCIVLHTLVRTNFFTYTKFLIASTAFILVSCQNSAPPAVLQSEGSEPKKEIVEVDKFEQQYFDYKVFEKSNFTENQLTLDVVYVFGSTCALFESENQDIIITYLKCGEALTVLGKSDTYYRDSLTNAYGSLLHVQCGERIGFVFSGFVSKMPYPATPNLSFVEYGKMYLHLIDSVECSGFKGLYDDGTPSDEESENFIYKFEQGIVIAEKEGYESSYETIYIPGLAVEEGFYILQAFGRVDLFAYFENQIPDYEMAFDYQKPMIDAMAGEARINEHGFLTFVGALPDGCGSWYQVVLETNGIVITAGSGC